MNFYLGLNFFRNDKSQGWERGLVICGICREKKSCIGKVLLKKDIFFPQTHQGLAEPFIMFFLYETNSDGKSVHVLVFC